MLCCAGCAVCCAVLRAQREKVLAVSAEAGEQQGKATYKGMNAYVDYKSGFRREGHTVGAEKGTGSHGPLRGNVFVRSTARCAREGGGGCSWGGLSVVRSLGVSLEVAGKMQYVCRPQGACAHQHGDGSTMQEGGQNTRLRQYGCGGQQQRAGGIAVPLAILLLPAPRQDVHTIKTQVQEMFAISPAGALNLQCVSAC